ncbi:putative leucine-rich repeat domain superfamily [Helianthus debilis subsp. tardiflorus]
MFLYDCFRMFNRSSQLRRLEMAHKVFIGDLTTNALMKFPVLEELNLYAIIISKEEIETVGRYCPMLKTLKVNRRAWRPRVSETDEGSLMRFNENAIAIGQNLPKLRHLELIGNSMTNIGLRVILDNCHHLETLDLRECFRIDLEGDLGKQCSKQIKYLKLPNDSLEGCPYLWIISKEDYQDSGDNNDGYDSDEVTLHDFGVFVDGFDDLLDK